MKLIAAKCPKCNADIEVNETLDKAICQYCGSTILIESAIQKHKMEITGTIKIDGIQSNSENGSIGLINSIAQLFVDDKITLDQAKAQIEERNIEILNRTIMQMRLKKGNKV